MKKTETKIEKGFNRYEAELINDFMLMIGKLDGDNRISERQLRRMLYHTGVFMYRHYHNLGAAEDPLFPSMKSLAKPHPMRELVNKK